LEEETRIQALERKALAERMAAEAERKRKEQELAEEQRKAAARKPPTANGAGEEPLREHWPLLVYVLNLDRNYTSLPIDKLYTYFELQFIFIILVRFTN
jgi:hypothetical protein